MAQFFNQLWPNPRPFILQKVASNQLLSSEMQQKKSGFPLRHSPPFLSRKSWLQKKSHSKEKVAPPSERFSKIVGHHPLSQPPLHMLLQKSKPPGGACLETAKADCGYPQVYQLLQSRAVELETRAQLFLQANSKKLGHPSKSSFFSKKVDGILKSTWRKNKKCDPHHSMLQNVLQNRGPEKICISLQ
jgi:hypothetical protein